MIYTLAVFFPWLAFFLRGRIFSAVFSFILWIIFGYNIFAFVFSGGGVFGISLILESFFLWVILTVWCCLVMHSDQKQEDMEQLINVINGIVKANSGKSLHLETQQTNEANDMKQSVSETAKANSNETNTTRIFICMVIFFLAIILLVAFFIKGGYQLSNNQRIDAKNPSHENYKKNDNNRSKPLNP
ncbi:flagellar biosynthesis protein FlgG [Helicobacter pylori]|nr:flagellar biosynthesis protein FlgG [Helicobacter pylori]